MNSKDIALNYRLPKLVFFLMKKQLRFLSSLFLFFFGINAFAQEAVVVVFHQDTTENYADRDFLKNHFPDLASYAKENKIDLRLQNVKNGAPEGLINTPSIHYFANDKHTVFKGRYTEVQRIQSWITVSSIAPIKNKPFKVENAFYGGLNSGNAYAFPVKLISNYSADAKKEKLPNEKDIEKEFRKEFANKSDSYEFKQQIELHYQNRKYYLDFYPYVTNKKFHITVKVFSEFHCKEPIFNTEQALESSLKNWRNAVLQAKLLAIEEIKKVISTGKTGDAHTGFIPEKYPVITAKDFGLEESKETISKAFQPLANEWYYSSKENKGKLQFLIPNTIYTGEIRIFDAQLNLDNLVGRAEANLKTVNTGDEGLDESIMDRIMSDKHSISTIEFKETLMKPKKEIDSWSSYNYTFLCDFTFAGKTVEETVDVMLTPIYNKETKETELFCYAHFSIYMMRQFGIESGVGDSKAEDTVEFYLNFKLKSK